MGGRGHSRCGGVGPSKDSQSTTPRVQLHLPPFQYLKNKKIQIYMGLLGDCSKVFALLLVLGVMSVVT